MKKLYRLRVYFIVYFIAKAIVDIAFGSDITVRSITNIKISPMMFYGFVAVINVILFLLGLWLFSILLDKKNWARIIFLVLGWLAIVDAISSLFFSSNITEMLTLIDRDADWNRLILIDRITDFVGLIFWGYAVYILQFNVDVKKIFLPGQSEDLNSQKSK